MQRRIRQMIDRRTQVGAARFRSEALTETQQQWAELEAANGRLNEANLQLETANEQKDRFLALLAHELRNPLGTCCNALAVMRLRSSGDPDLARSSEVLLRQIQYMQRLIDDLLDISRVRCGKMEVRRQRLDLVLLARETAEDRRVDLEAAGLLLTLELPEEPVWVAGDPTRLAQVLTNLLTNAIKFTERGDQVTVQVARETAARMAALTVRDSGIGIERHMLPRLFEPFTQALAGDERNRSGLGLGLALVKSLAELHGGEVRASSEGRGRGSEFTFLIPQL